jgi:HAD superfamily hydrolase (TIGR01509 family)
MKNKKYILWDHDGVLVDTEVWFYRASIRALSELGIKVEKNVYMDFMQDGRSLWSMAREQGFPEEIITAKRRKRDAYYQAYLVHENIEIPGVEKTLSELSKRFSMAIITTSKRKHFELIHKNRSIVKYMDFVLTLEDYRNAKPHPEPYLTALQKFGARPEEALIVEDSGRGLKSALAAGIDCIIVENAFTLSHDFTGANMMLKSLPDLINVLISWKHTT